MIVHLFSLFMHLALLSYVCCRSFIWEMEGSLDP